MTVNPNNQEAVCVTRFKSGCPQLVFIYQGRAGGLFMPPLNFLRLSGAARRNMAMFRDFGRNYYHGEIHPDWPNIDVTLENQRQIKAQCTDASELYCSGTSAGGYAAILFGHYLQADIVYAFGAQTLVERDSSDAELDFPPAHRDLSILLKNWNGKTRYKLYYAVGCKADRIYAERMAGCPGVELCPVPGSSHDVFEEIDEVVLLGGLFPPLQAENENGS
ncbi:MAG: hypothetical protein V7744_20015 [Pseudomonadales bacterium]